jgi:outer membrane lipoprotein-sorting protein
MLNRNCTGWLIVAVLVAACPALAETLEEVEKKFKESAKKLESMTANVETKTDMEMPGGMMSVKDHQKGRYAWMKKGDKIFMRTETKGESIRKMGEQEMKSKSETKMVMDGEHVWMLTDNAGQKMCIKQNPQEGQSYDPKGMFEEWKKHYDLKLLESEKIDGKECWKIQAKPKEDKKDAAGGATGMDQHMSKMIIWIRKDIGFTVKMATYGKKDKEKPMNVTTYSDIKVNPDLDKKDFKFEPPEGVQVMDMTKMPQMPTPPETP